MQNKEFIQQLYDWPKAFISGSDLLILLDKSPNSRYAMLKRAVKDGYLIHLKRDLYLIAQKIKTHPLNNFEIAPLIYGPSYISLESSLSFFGWIPEAVPTTTSVCCKRSKDFSTPIGLFSYYRIPTPALPLGIRQLTTNRNETIFLSDPWKALADFIYVKKRSWLTINELCEDLRIDIEVLKKSDIELLSYLSVQYPSKRVKTVLKTILKYLINAD